MIHEIYENLRKRTAQNVTANRQSWRSGLLLAGLLIVLVTLAGSLPPAAAQSELSTLVPPTLIPTLVQPTATPLPPISALAHILADKDHPHLTIGILYNAPPFSSLTDTGDLVGFEADIGRAIAQDWGVQTTAGNLPIFRQVTRQNGLDQLASGQIDMLMGKIIHSRDAEKHFDFSNTLFVNHEVALTMGDNPASSITDLAGQPLPVGVVAGSPAEQALTAWQKQTNTTLKVQRLPLLDDGIRALGNRQLSAVVADRWELDARVGNGKVAGVKLLNGAFRDEPYAIAIRPGDDSLRLLIDRTLQRLTANGQLDAIYSQWFPPSILPPDQRSIPIPWTGLDDDKRTISDFPTDIVLPAQSVLTRITTQKTLRVAGINSPDATGKLSLLDTFDQALINEMAKRWGVTVTFVPGGTTSAEDQVASGAADLAVGLEAHWGTSTTPDRVDFVSVYAVHGYRLMVASARTIRTFSDMLISKNIGIYADDPKAFDLAVSIAKGVNVIDLRKYPITSDDDIVSGIANGDLNAIFGDSLRVIPYALANPTLVLVTDKEYTRQPLAFAVPRNDSDFRAMVAETVQDMAADGTYQALWKAQFNIGNPLSIGYWP